MLENFSASTELKFKDLSPEEKQARGILGRLYGPIADIVRSTRNGRKYSESLWTKVFENPITKEMFAQGGVPGELDHPIDREETCSEKIAIMMPEPPTKDNEGHLIGYFDIIDTPCGRIAYALAKYGFNLGISSRGSGDTFLDYNGEETVDEDTYSFNAFDLVLLPACKDARLQLAESYDTKKIKFNQAIQEAMNKATAGEKKIMTETLDNLKFYDDNKANPQTEEQSADEKTENTEVADNVGTEMMESLQKVLKENRTLRNDLISVQEKLSVSYTKEMKLKGELSKLRVAIKNLTESANRASALEAQLSSLKAHHDKQVQVNAQQAQLLESYKKELSKVGLERKTLSESTSQKDSQITELRRQVGDLQEKLQTVNKGAKSKIESLTNEISGLKQDSEVRHQQYSQKMQKSNRLVESYKKIAIEAMDRYIESKAANLGISANEIKNKLCENYSFNDIDAVCEELRQYKRNLSKLPFNLGSIGVERVTLTEDTTTKKFTNPDDIIDKDLFNLLNNQ